MQEIWNNLEILEKYKGNVSKKIREISHPDLIDIISERKGVK